MKNSELITIGIPVYNEGEFLACTLESCVGQAKKVVIFDNASTDSTEDICREYAERYNNIEYIRNETNQGQVASFWGVQNRAETPYFSWMGAHDAIPEGYVDTALALLRNSDAVAIHSPIQYVDKKTREELFLIKHTDVEKLSSANAWERVLSLICYLRNTMVYGIFKIDVLRNAWIEGRYLGTDHVYMCKVAAEGKILYTTDTYRILAEDPQESKEGSLKRWRTSLSEDGKSLIALEHETMIQGQLKVLKRTLPPGDGKKLLDKAESILRYRFEEKTLFRRVKLSLKKRFVFKTKNLF